MDGNESALRVMPGMESPGSISTGLAQRFQFGRRSRLAPQDYVQGVLSGNRPMLARAITLIESELPEDYELSERVLEGCISKIRDSVRVGITGVPGVGKSTFIEVLGNYLIEERRERVAVLAVDPSSPLSRGSILGDKTRMAKLGANPMAFIRPSPARGSLGGVARKTRETILLCEAAGYRNVLVETVGVGQSETTVASMVDFFLLLMLSTAGDELQGIKRGIFEMADLVAINKCDGTNKTACDVARRQYQSALSLFPPTEFGWKPRVTTCSSVSGDNISKIWEIVLEHQAQSKSTGFFQARRRDQFRQWMYEAIGQSLRERFFHHPVVQKHLPAIEKDVVEGRVSSFRAARRLLRDYDGAEQSD